MDEVGRIELLRRRWRRAREPLDLVDPEQESFGRGRIPTAAGTIPARLLILPADPEEHLIQFDDEFWLWWKTDHLDLHTGEAAIFEKETSTSQASYRYAPRGGRQWRRYLAVTHAGGLEMGLGDRDAVYDVQRPGRPDLYVFRLLTLVGRVGTALNIYGKVIQQYHPKGPWEVSLALIGTEGSVLGDLASGYEPPEEKFDDELRRNIERHVLIRRELEAWPEDSEVQDLAYAIGDQLEGAWGHRRHAYFVGHGDNKGKFDVSNYYWR